MAALLGGTALADRTDPATDDRICAAALRCVARRGLRKTTLDDVANEAGCSRATVYRAFPGGKDVLMAAAAAREVDRLLDELARDLERATHLEDALVIAVTGATRSLLGHEAFTYLMAHEPRVVLPHLSFEGLDPVLARAVEFLAPTLERFVDPHAARRVAEWTARLTVLYFDDTAPFDLSDPADVRQLVAIHVLPGIDAAVQQEQ
jgi:AcrR family transcriptional regulator